MCSLNYFHIYSYLGYSDSHFILSIRTKPSLFPTLKLLLELEYGLILFNWTYLNISRTLNFFRKLPYILPLFMKSWLYRELKKSWYLTTINPGVPYSISSSLPYSSYTSYTYRGVLLPKYLYISFTYLILLYRF